MATPFPPANVKILTVGELTRSLKAVVEEGYPSVWVEGEVSNYKKHTSGHVYLTLKDEEAPLKPVMYRAVALRLPFDLRDGMRIIFPARLPPYIPPAEYQTLSKKLH